MATSTCTAAALSIPTGTSDRTQKVIRAYFSVVVGAGDYTTGGLTLDLTPVTRGLPVSINGLILSSVDSQHAAATPSTNWFKYRLAKGTTLANGVLQIFGLAASNGITELAATTTPAGVTGDVIRGFVDFQMGT